jgi:hypothetical protein
MTLPAHLGASTVTGILTPELHTTLNSDFANWMRLRGLSLSTVAQYVGILQAFFRQADPADPDSVTAYADGRALRTVSRLHTAYGQWTAFQNAQGNSDWSSIDGTKLPQEVLAPLSVLLGGRCRVAVRLRWEHAVRDGDGHFTGQILHPDDRGSNTRYLVFQSSDSFVSMLKRLEEWGQPLGADSPLLPVEPGSSFPRNERVLGKERKQGELLRMQYFNDLAEAEWPGGEGTDFPELDGPEKGAQAPENGSSGPALTLATAMTPEARREALSDLLGREPTEKEREVYGC